MARFQRGSLRVESRRNGETWVLRYFVTRHSDGRRVEHKIPIGLVHDFPTESLAWAEVERQHLQLNEPDFKPRMTFAHLAQHFMTHELGEQSETADPKSHTTIAGYKRILKNRCIDRWGKRPALSLEPLEIEQWLKALKRDEGLANPTLDKIRRVMSLVFKHGQRHGLIPRNQESNPMRFVRCKTTSSYEAMILTPKQAFDILMHLQEPERSLTLLASATVGFHNLRHSLASFLVRSKTDPKTVQALLRHSDVKTTLQLYAHSISEDRMAAQGQVLEAILQSGSTAVK
jgi:hypothetical protein